MKPEEFEEFQRLTRSPDAAYAERMLKVFRLIRSEIAWIDEARSMVPNAQAEKRTLQQIGSAARKLATLLRSSAASRRLLVSDLDKPMYEVVPLLDEIAKSASKFLEHDEAFRRELTLPAPEKAAASVAALVVWPRAFAVWTARGNRLSYTPDGPLHRFLTLIHVELKLPPPTASAIREAVKRYYMADRSQKLRSQHDIETS